MSDKLILCGVVGGLDFGDCIFDGCNFFDFSYFDQVYIFVKGCEWIDCCIDI